VEFNFLFPIPKGIELLATPIVAITRVRKEVLAKEVQKISKITCVELYM
jgi:hypothetical protein